MMLSLLFAAITGFSHAFEADHLLAVSSIVTRRQSLALAVKDGIAWGLGHTSTIFAIGALIIVARVAIPESAFSYLEGCVGLMLIGLGAYRLLRVLRQRGGAAHAHPHEQGHGLAYGVGLVHGLAGSGSLVLLVMSQIPGQGAALGYLLVFGIGSVAGMLLASGVFSLPLSQSVASRYSLRLLLTLLSSLLCIGFGLQVAYEHLIA
jgi:hypothetical protein